MLGSDTEGAEMLGAYFGMAAPSQIGDRRRVSFEDEDRNIECSLESSYSLFQRLLRVEGSGEPVRWER